ncbi:MAG: amidohydrolase family protein [Planctomycetota bacterium]
MQLTGALILPDPLNPAAVTLGVGAVTIRDGRIASVEVDDTASLPTLPPGTPLISPAFTDAHVHLPQFPIVGAHGRPLLDWLAEVTFPAEMRWADTERARADLAGVLDRLLSVGTVGIGAYSTVHHAAADLALSMCKQRGLRARIGHVLMNEGAPEGLLRPADELLEQSAELLDRHGASGRVAAAVTPRFALSCSQDLMEGAGRLAAEHDAVIQTHLSENTAECAEVERRFGKPYVQVYADAGLLTSRAVFGHVIHVNDADRQALSDAGAIAAHCPTANTFLGSGDMDRARLLATGVRVAPGSDIGGGYDVSMPRVARAMMETAWRRDQVVIPSTEAWFDITAGSAAALGWPDAGTLQPDAPADLVVLAPPSDWLNHPDPLGRLLWGWDDRWLRATLAHGEVVHGSV